METKSLFFVLFLSVNISGMAFEKSADSLKVRNLPIVITNTFIQNSKAPVVLLISGDGGWYKFEQTIADDLAKRGIPTIGLDSRKYFWSRITPETTADEMAQTLNYYGSKWGRDKFVIIGYSLGAEIVPFIVNRFPDDLRLKIDAAVLMSPTSTTDFEIHITSMLGIGNRKNTYNTISEITNMQDTPTLIIYGDDEKTQVPDLLKGTSVIIRKIPGDHHYKFDVPLIIETMRVNKVF